MLRSLRAVAALFLIHLASDPAAAQAPRRTQNLILVTIDGFRWREAFTGADSTMLGKASYVAPHVKAVVDSLKRGTPEERRRALLPFLWSVVAREGQIYGNRPLGCSVSVTNGHWYSYPGYNEIFTGLADDSVIKSNAPLPNPNVTFLEHANRLPAFRGRVASVAGWDVFPFILNEARSGVPVQAGWDLATGPDLTARERVLNEVLAAIPPQHASRPDAFTYGYALEYLRRAHPRILHVGFNEIDQFAHLKSYENYLRAARDIDGFIRGLWSFAQSDPQYRGRTTLIVITDHGRGEGEKWSDHNRRTEHSNEIWLAVLGPDTPARGEVASCSLRQNQLARTVSELLGLGYTGKPGTGEPITELLGR